MSQTLLFLVGCQMEEGEAGPSAVREPEFEPDLWIDVVASFEVVCGLRQSGAVECWGDDSYGVISGRPDELGFTEVTTDGRGACALPESGVPICWGEGTGDGVAQPDESFVAIDAGFGSMCGLTAEGGISCWGNCEDDRCDVPSGTFTQLSAGSLSCAVAIHGGISCWGSSMNGILEAPEGVFRQVSVESMLACALDLDGAPTCWGDWVNWGLPPVPDDARSGLEIISVAQVEACAVREGAILCWDGIHGEVPEGHHFVDVSVGDKVVCGLTDVGGIVCWGDNDHGELEVPE